MLSWTRRLATVCVLVLASCRSPTTPRHVVLGAEPTFTVSLQGLNVAVTVTNVELACAGPHRIFAHVSGQDIHVWPYVTYPDVPCEAITGYVTQSVSVKVPKAGEYVVAVHGWSYSDGPPHEIVVTRTLSVGGG